MKQVLPQVFTVQFAPPDSIISTHLDNPPDVIWPAYWHYSTPTYNSSVTPYGLPCISDSMWGDQQRIFQYTGAHMETWGNVTMYVDLNAIDGIVADISRQVGVPTTTLQNSLLRNRRLSPPGRSRTPPQTAIGQW